MSKSYKKYPIIVQEKDDMRQWNRSLRHNKLAEIPNGSAYKKDSRRSGIWKYRWSEEDARVFYRRCLPFGGWIKKFKDEEDFINRYYKREVLRK